MSRYDIPGGEDAEFQRGSMNLVLRNLLDISTVDAIERAESLALADAKFQLLDWFEDQTVITVQMIVDLHKIWLGSIYAFAGQYRTVNMSKPGITFCVADHIQANMETLEREHLFVLTPCNGLSLEEVCNRVAKVHAEFLLIHPFREGNGRLARWIADLMIMQAGFPSPNYNIFGSNSARGLEPYFQALKKGYFHEDVRELSQLFQGWVKIAVGDP